MSKSDLPKYCYADGDAGRFFVKGPNGKKKRYRDEATARAAALALVEFLEDERKLKILNQHQPTVAHAVDAWFAEREQHYAAKGGTKYNNRAKMLRIKREMGHLTVREIRPVDLELWLKFCKTGDTFMKWRLAWRLLFRYAVSQDWLADNPADKVEPRPTSKVLAYNRKKRQRLDKAGFLAIYEKAEPWLQVAMDLALLTGHGRYEICNMEHGHFRNGRLFIVREKVAGETDASRVSVKLNPDLDEVRSRSVRLMGDTLCRFLVHRARDRDREDWRKAASRAGKDDRYVVPNYLGIAFAEARDATHLWDHLDKESERPTFHEIRSLVARTMKAQGVPIDQVRALLTHADQSMTQVYLDKGKDALSDEDYTQVEAPLTRAQLLK